MSKKNLFIYNNMPSKKLCQRLQKPCLLNRCNSLRRKKNPHGYRSSSLKTETSFYSLLMRNRRLPGSKNLWESFSFLRGCNNVYKSYFVN